MNNAKEKARERRKLEKELLFQISQLEQAYVISSSPDVFRNLQDLRNSLQHLYDFKLKGLVVRSRARWVEHGEKSTKYFLNLEKRNKAINTIFQIKKSDGNLSKNNDEILRELKLFYEKL